MPHLERNQYKPHEQEPDRRLLSPRELFGRQAFLNKDIMRYQRQVQELQAKEWLNELPPSDAKTRFTTFLALKHEVQREEGLQYALRRNTFRQRHSLQGIKPSDMADLSPRSYEEVEEAFFIIRQRTNELKGDAYLLRLDLYTHQIPFMTSNDDDNKKMEALSDLCLTGEFEALHYVLNSNDNSNELTQIVKAVKADPQWNKGLPLTP